MSMSDADIRAKILRLHYDLQKNRPGDDFIIDELLKLIPGVPQNLLDYNLHYLCKSRLIREVAVVPNRATPLLTRITKMGIDRVDNRTRLFFYDMGQLVSSHAELKDDEKKKIESILAKLEELMNKGSLTKTNINKAKEALAKHGWLISILTEVLMKLGAPG